MKERQANFKQTIQELKSVRTSLIFANFQAMFLVCSWHDPVFQETFLTW